MVALRLERPGDEALIASIVQRAFLDAPHRDGTEQHVVGALRRAGALTLSLVADERGIPIGHLAVSPVTVSDGTEGWYGLGPVAVVPERQRQGVGTTLVGHALGQLRSMGAQGCVVLGDPSYYGRFGFQATSSLVLSGVPPEYFQVVSFCGSTPAGTVAYHPAFGATS